jgi:hypothetical protein
MALVSCFRQFSSPTLFYDYKSHKVICSDETKKGKAVATEVTQLEEPADEILADQNHIFVPYKNKFFVFDPFTGKEVLSIPLEGDFKRFDYFPRGKIRHSRCFNNGNSNFPTGRGYTNPSELDVKLLVILESTRYRERKGEYGVMESYPVQEKFSAFSVFNLKGKRTKSAAGTESSLLFKWDTRKVRTKNLVWKPEYEDDFGEPPEVESPELIESVAFLTANDLVFTISYDNQGFPGPETMSYLVHVNISTGKFKALYPHDIDPKGPSDFYPKGEIFALPTGQVVSFVSESYVFSAHLESLYIEDGKLRHSPVYPNFVFGDEMFWIFPPEGNEKEGPVIGFGADNGSPMIVLGPGGLRQERNMQANYTSPANETKLLIVTDYPEEAEGTTLEEVQEGAVVIASAVEVLDVRTYHTTKSAIQSSQVGYLGENLVCFHEEGDSTVYSYETKRMTTLEDTDVTKAFSLRNSRSWNKFLFDSFNAMVTQIPSEISRLILKFI